MSMLHHKMKHHPDVSTLMSYAAGSLPEPLALIIASHCTVCSTCAAEVESMERLGAAVFAELAPASLEKAAPVMALRGLESEVLTSASPTAVRCDDDGEVSQIPLPLRHLIGGKLDDIQWQRLGMGVWHAPVLQQKPTRGDVRLLRVEPGRAMPEHGHGGTELTMILSGSYHDEVGDFGPGDVADLDTDVEHRPVADALTGCICIIASEKQAVFKGFFARMIQPLTGI
jgi:putative transcriptional regulator